MVEARVERRLAAILAADIAGYSRLMGVDEEGTLARLNAHRREFLEPTITEHRGRIVKRTGDGILIEFSSAVDATRCAIQTQRGMAERNAGISDEQRIEIRIGIHVGDIIIEDDGDIFGDGVNIAARLESIAQPGGICISDDAYRQVRDKLAANFHDSGEQQLKNIARPVRVYELRADPSAPPKGPSASSLALPDKPSIAVLPFQNMSGDPEQDYFADGMVEDIITGLSRINWLFVIARNSSFVYKGKPIDVKQVGRELGVRYVLEGSVRKAANRVRITGQLIEAESGAHLWADRYDGALEDVFDLQDKITETIVGIIEPNLQRAEIERARRKRTENLGAYDLYLRALPHLASVMPGDANIGIGLLEEALKLDPNYASAHAYLSWGLETRVARGRFDEADVIDAVRHARTALTYGSDDSTALAVATIALLHLGYDFEAASGAIARALALNSSSATALYFGAHIHAFSGDTAVAEDYAPRALRISPFDTLSFMAHEALGLVRVREGRYADAASHFAKAVQANPRFSWLYAAQAAALALAGRVEEARLMARRILDLEPTFRIKPLVDLLSPIIRPELVSALTTGFGQAGLPE
jgi:TolB-like protein/Flp pilus assembly protein TadD